MKDKNKEVEEKIVEIKKSEKPLSIIDRWDTDDLFSNENRVIIKE